MCVSDCMCIPSMIHLWWIKPAVSIERWPRAPCSRGNRRCERPQSAVLPNVAWSSTDHWATFHQGDYRSDLVPCQQNLSESVFEGFNTSKQLAPKSTWEETQMSRYRWVYEAWQSIRATAVKREISRVKWYILRKKVMIFLEKSPNVTRQSCNISRKQL